MNLTNELPTNGRVSYNNGATSDIPTGTMATFYCEDGYFLNGTMSRTCQNDGSWNSTTPRCERKLLVEHHFSFYCELSRKL